MRRAGGFAHPAALLVLVSAVLIIGIAGYAVSQANKPAPTDTATASTSKSTSSSTSTSKTTTTQTADAAPTEQQQVAAALKSYCQNTYRLVWEGAYNISIDPNKVTASYDTTIANPAVFEPNYAVLNAASCDTPQLTQAQKFAPFILYLQKTDNTWQGYTRTQSLPDCSQFDGKGWPASVIAQCNDSGTTRAPK